MRTRKPTELSLLWNVGQGRLWGTVAEKTIAVACLAVLLVPIASYARPQVRVPKAIQ